MRKRQIKNSSRTKEKHTDKDYAGTEASPYREWQQRARIYDGDDISKEPPEANPDVLPESTGLFYQRTVEDDRLDMILSLIPTLTKRQQEILRLCGNEGRTIANCAATLKISRGTVQKTLDRIREKLSVIQNTGFPTKE